MAYENEDIQFGIYAFTKEQFEAQKNEHTRFGLIGTGEVWIDGAYYPFAPEVNASSLQLRFNVQNHLDTATIYSIYQGLNTRFDILVPKITTGNKGYLELTPKKANIDLEGETAQVVEEFELSPKTQSIANATESNDGLATANDVKVTLEDYIKRGEDIDAGLAKDLTGVLEPTSEEFVYRASGGENKSIRDESAVIRKIKGSTIIWEQRLQSIPTREDFEGVTTTYDSITNECIIRNISRTSNYSSGSTRWQIKPDLYTTVGHKYLIASNKHYNGIGVFVNNVFYECDRIFTATASAIMYFRIDKTFNFASSCPVGSELRLRLNCFDLTEMFGEGNEPSTIDEFKEIFPLSYYDYSEPTIKGMSVDTIKTVGFNNFSKARASYGIINKDGTIGSSYVYYVDTFRVLADTSYYLKDVANGANNIVTYALYDSSMTLLNVASVRIGSSLNISTTITTPSNAAYMRIACHGDYLDSCCINIRHSRVHDGEYKEYEEHTLSIPEIGKYFPHGLQGLGDTCDEMTADGIVRRFGVVNLSLLNWELDSRSGVYRAQMSGHKVYGLALCDRYSIADVTETSMEDMHITLASRAYIAIKDSSVADIYGLYDVLMGKHLVYELDTEEHIDVDEPLQLDYWVNDWGTEEALSQDVSTPFQADIVYAFNAEGRIRDNERNIERLEDSVRELKAPYIIKSFGATDFLDHGDSLQIDIDPDDLRGGAISQALKDGRPVYLRATVGDENIKGLVAMRYCYEEDAIYFGFDNPFDEDINYVGEIWDDRVNFSRYPLILPTEVATATPIVRYSGTPLPASIPPNMVIWYAFSTNNVITLPNLADGDSECDNKWKIRVSHTSSDMVDIPYNVAWRGGQAPTWSEYSMCEFTFFKDDLGNIYGEWATYQPI